MPPVIALIISSAFSFAAIRANRAAGFVGSKALLIPLLWYLFVASRPPGSWVSLSVGGDDLGGNLVDQVVFSTLFGCGLVILNRRRRNLKDLASRFPAVLVLTIFYFISITWSDLPFVSLKRWTKEAGAVVMALVIASEDDPKHAIIVLFKRTILILIPLSLTLIKYYPDLGRVYGRWSGKEMWVGVTFQKNGLGRLCLFALLFLTWSFFSRRRAGVCLPKNVRIYEILVSVIALFLLKGPPDAYAATAIACLGVGVMILVSAQYFPKTISNVFVKNLAPICGLLFIVGTTIPFVGAAHMGAMSNALGRDSTLTGRTEIWEGLEPYVFKSPFLGSGFGAFWTPDAYEEHREKEAHNGYLDVLLQGGFIGLALTGLFILALCRRCALLVNHDFEWAILAASMLVIVLFHNVTESSIDSFGTRHLMATLLVFSMAATVPMPSETVGKWKILADENGTQIASTSHDYA